jgi:hypothetical protein
MSYLLTNIPRDTLQKQDTAKEGNKGLTTLTATTRSFSVSIAGEQITAANNMKTIINLSAELKYWINLNYISNFLKQQE